nr:hypothetical protein [uncultured Lichenicoccus sp.]
MNWYEIFGLAIVGAWIALALLVAVPLALLIRWYDRAERRRQVTHQRRNGGISLPAEYQHQHWVDLSR